MSDLLLKMENQGYVNITYMVVNNQEERSRRLHHLLKERLPDGITLYAQEPGQADVWQAVNAEKDDILVYDRCGRLTYHLSLPYTILSYPYVEESIRMTYCKKICGECDAETSLELDVCINTADVKPETDTHAPAEEERNIEETNRHHRGHHGHGHHHHGHHQEGMERQGHPQQHRHEGHQHHSQQQVVLGQVQMDFGQVALNEPPVMKRP